MQFEGQFAVPLSPDDVMVAFEDIPRMASCMPGAVIDGRDDDGSYRGAMVVSFGPKRIKLQGKVHVNFNPETRTGTMVGRGAADLRAARVEVQIHFAVTELRTVPINPPSSLVSIKADAKMGGVLAEFARTGGAAVAGLLMREFAECLSKELRPQPIASESTIPQRVNTADVSERPAALSAYRVLWAVLLNRLRALFGKGT